MNPENSPKKIRRGRPRTLGLISNDNYDVKDYNKLYYEKVYKKKCKGDFLCDVCNVYCSIANKSRHNKSRTHQDLLEVEQFKQEYFDSFDKEEQEAMTR